MASFTARASSGALSAVRRRYARFSRGSVSAFDMPPKMGLRARKRKAETEPGDPCRVTLIDVYPFGSDWQEA